MIVNCLKTCLQESFQLRKPPLALISYLSSWLWTWQTAKEPSDNIKWSFNIYLHKCHSIYYPSKISTNLCHTLKMSIYSNNPTSLNGIKYWKKRADIPFDLSQQLLLANVNVCIISKWIALLKSIPLIYFTTIHPHNDIHDFNIYL